MCGTEIAKIINKPKNETEGFGLTNSTYFGIKLSQALKSHKIQKKIHKNSFILCFRESNHASFKLTLLLFLTVCSMILTN